MNKHSEQFEAAVRSGQISLVERLLRVDPEIVNRPSVEEELPLEIALDTGMASMVRRLEQDCAESAQTFTGNPAMARCLLENGADLERVGASGVSIINEALLDASFEDNLDPLRCLLEAGLDPNYCAEQKFDAVLIETGIDPDDLENLVPEPLISRVALNSLEAARLVLSYGPDVNLRNLDGWSALMFAAAFDTASHAPEAGPEIVRLLLEAGADPLVRSRRRTAREIAEPQSTADIAHNVQVIEMLRQAECGASE